MKKIIILFVVIVAVLSLTGFYIYQLMYGGKNFRGEVMPQPIHAKDFTLINQYNENVSLSKYDGKIIVLSFVYTHCPDVCPAIVMELNKAHDELIKRGVDKDVVFIFVSVDPDRDTPEAFREWAKSLHAEDFIYLTGSNDAVAKVWRDYGIYVEISNESSGMPMHQGHEGYIVTHTAIVYLIDRNLNIRVTFEGPPPSWSYEDVINDILRLVNE